MEFFLLRSKVFEECPREKIEGKNEPPEPKKTRKISGKERKKEEGGRKMTGV